MSRCTHAISVMAGLLKRCASMAKLGTQLEAVHQT